MQNKIIYEAPHCTIAHNREQMLMVVKWKGVINYSALKDGCNRQIQIAKGYATTRILHDTTHIIGSWERYVTFLTSEFAPRIREGGVKHVAIVYGKDTILRNSAKKQVKNLKSENTKIFSQRKVALAWLLNEQLKLSYALKGGKG